MASVETRAFSVDEYHRMAEVSILSETDRVEFVQGEIIKTSPIGSRHAACVNRLNTILNRQIAQEAIASVQNPVRLDDCSEPQADLALLKPQADFYSRSLPAARDLFLIIEVVETSPDYDLNAKLPLYARAGFRRLGDSPIQCLGFGFRP